MNIELLISCMGQDSHEIVKNTNIHSDALIVNQCDIDNREEFEYVSNLNICRVRTIYSRERGLSRSRNMAIYNSLGDICLICDDDERLVDNYTDIIKNAFQKHPDADVIVFKFNNLRKDNFNKTLRINKLRSLRISSVQIAFRKQKILDNDIQFDIKMGAGTNNGAGEENKFLFDCLDRGMKILFVPQIIGSLNQSLSTWFFGYTKKYMCDKGWVSRRIMGPFYGYLYLLYFSVFKYPIYKGDCGFFEALIHLNKGFFEKR